MGTEDADGWNESLASDNNWRQQCSNNKFNNDDDGGGFCSYGNENSYSKNVTNVRGKFRGTGGRRGRGGTRDGGRRRGGAFSGGYEERKSNNGFAHSRSESPGDEESSDNLQLVHIPKTMIGRLIGTLNILLFCS